MEAKGRRGAPDVFRDTSARGSAEQAMLLKQDKILKALRAIRDEADLASIQTALQGIDLTDVELK